MLLSSSKSLDRGVRDDHGAHEGDHVPAMLNSRSRIAAERSVSC